MKTLLICLCALPLLVWAQPQAENHIPYIETNAKADSLVVPDEIYLNIQLREQDERTKVSVEQLEKRMFEALRQLDIDIEKQLKLADLSSNIKTYFLRRKDIKKSKRFELKLHDATTAGRVLAALEEKGISNVHLSKTDYSKLEELKLHLLSKAVAKAKKRARAMAKPLGQQVAEAIFISDSHSGFVGYRRNTLDEVVMFSMAEADVAPAPDIQFKPQKIQVSVQIRFRLSK
ncbi:MAG: SIMPL domain-containing protein [Flavobacteriaceae bacterium]